MAVWQKVKKKRKHSSKPIIIGYLEKVNSRVFDRYQEQITGLIKRNQGIYALYRRHKLYYIGLASDLKRRIWYHLRDRHKGKWDRFSLYIIKKKIILVKLNRCLSGSLTLQETRSVANLDAQRIFSRHLRDC